MLCVLLQNRNRYPHEEYEEVLGLHGKTLSVTFLRHPNVHHTELEFLVRQLLTLFAFPYALRDGMKHELLTALQFLVRLIAHQFQDSLPQEYLTEPACQLGFLDQCEVCPPLDHDDQ